MYQVLFPHEGELWSAFIERIAKHKRELIIIISGQRDRDLLHQEKQCQLCLQTIANRSKKTLLATHNSTLITLAKARGIECVQSSRSLKELLRGHPQYQEAIREFLPQVWRQHLRSRLQAMGLLSLPKVRIWVLLIVSLCTFVFAVFKLLPGAEITITPRQEPIVQTSNIFLVQSGASLQELPERVRSVPLLPIETTITRTITFDGVGQEFLGTSATTTMEIRNESANRFSLRQNSRLANNAGIVFLTQEPIRIDPGEVLTIQAKAADFDLYDEVIGKRGNVPANLRWNFVGLANDDQQLVYATNITEGAGGETSTRLVYRQNDLATARRFLEQSLLLAANQEIDEKIIEYNLTNTSTLTRLYYDELRAITYENFSLSENLLGQSVTSVPVTGTIRLKAFAYNRDYVLNILASELEKHVTDNKEIITDSMSVDSLSTHVMEYDDAFEWIKITVDLTAIERPILLETTESGLDFSNRVREAVVGELVIDARRIIGNMPEVEKVDISVWPPWGRVLPSIPYNILITIDHGA